MKHRYIATAIAASVALTMSASSPSFGQDTAKIGLLMGFTGPIESLTVGIAAGLAEHSSLNAIALGAAFR